MIKLKIASFNLDDDNGAFPDRIYSLSNIIYKNRFDIICLQEDFNSNKFSSGKFLNLELDYNFITTKTKEKTKNNILSSSNLTILSKYDIALLDVKYFNKNKDNETACQFIEIDIEDSKILLINTFLNHNSGEEIDLILKNIKNTYKYKLILFCGTLNSSPNFPEIKKIRDFGFLDKNSDFTHEDKLILDYIFYKSKLKLSVYTKIILKGFSNHNCLESIFRFK